MRFLVCLFVVLATSGCGCEQVDEGQVGVQKKWGVITPTPVDPGLHVTWIGEEIVALSTKLSTYVLESGTASFDLQSVQTQTTIQYEIRKSTAPKLLGQLGGEQAVQEILFLPLAHEATKGAIAKYRAEDLIKNREKVKALLEDTFRKSVEETLAQKGLEGAIRVVNVALTNFEFGAEFNTSIEAKVRAEQEALRAVNEKTRKITEAEATAEEQVLQAEAEAKSIEFRSKARSEAIKREAEALRGNPALIQLRIAEKWNGQLPMYNGSGPIPMLSLKGAGD